jgi:hypothetical protein
MLGNFGPSIQDEIRYYCKLEIKEDYNYKCNRCNNIRLAKTTGNWSVYLGCKKCSSEFGYPVNQKHSRIE